MGGRSSNGARGSAYTATYTVNEYNTAVSKLADAENNIAAVKRQIDGILQMAKTDKPDDLVDYVWDKLYDAFPYSLDWDNSIKVLGNNRGEYNPDAVIEEVRIDLMEDRNGKLQVTLHPMYDYMKDFSDEELEYLGIYK